MEEKEKKNKSLLKVLLAVLIVLISFLGVLLGFDPSGDLRVNNLDNLDGVIVQTIEVIDGDTIRVKDVETEEVFRVRYLGIDTPEFDGLSYETCFADQAREKNEDLVLDQRLILEFDRDRYDRFGRTLAYVYTSDEDGEKDVFVNLELLQEGFARFYLDKQNTLYQDEFVEAALDAQEDFSGLWGACGEDEFDGKCVIKGNIGRSEQKYYEKYYHLPGDKYYSVTKVNLLKEDQWLCTIEEAKAKNFKRALQ